MEKQQQGESASGVADHITVLSTAVLTLLEVSARRQVGPIEFLKRTIQEEISKLLFKTLLGAVLAFTMAYSFLQLGEAFQGMTLQMENSYGAQALGFGSLATATAIAFFGLFQSTILGKLVRPKKEQPLPRMDLQLLLLEFAEGFIEGLTPRSQKEAAPNKTASSPIPQKSVGSVEL